MLAITLGSIAGYHAWFNAWLSLDLILGYHAWFGAWLLLIKYWLLRLVGLGTGYHAWLVWVLAITLGSNTGSNCWLSRLIQLLATTLDSIAGCYAWFKYWILYLLLITLGSIAAYHTWFKYCPSRLVRCLAFAWFDTQLSRFVQCLVLAWLSLIKYWLLRLVGLLGTDYHAWFKYWI